jgi:hypothetical protein
MPLRAAAKRAAEARRIAVDVAREAATIRADAAWERTYSDTFDRVYNQILAELLDDPGRGAAA